MLLAYQGLVGKNPIAIWFNTVYFYCVLNPTNDNHAAVIYVYWKLENQVCVD